MQNPINRWRGLVQKNNRYLMNHMFKGIIEITVTSVDLPYIKGIIKGGSTNTLINMGLVKGVDKIYDFNKVNY